MTLISEATQTIDSTFSSGWGTETPFALGNEALDTKDLAEWVRLTILHRLGGQHTLGNIGGRVYRRRAVVVLQIFVPQNAGTARANALVEKFRGIFEGETINGVAFDDGNSEEIGPDERWYQVNEEVSFNYDEIK